MNWTGGILVPREHDRGYYRVNLSIGGEVIDKYIHRLVAEAFIDNPENRDYVNHKDGDKQNNHWMNLEWATPKENTEHALDTGLAKRDYLVVRDKQGAVVHEGITVAELVLLGFQQPAISRCLSGKLHSHKSCTFEILKEIQ